MASGHDAEIIGLLRDVARRLKKSEAERKVLWQEIVEHKKTLTDIEDKTGQSEKAYISIQSKLDQRDRLTEDLVDRQDKIEQLQKKQETTLSSTKEEQEKLKTQISSTDKRIEKVSLESEKLSRRLEKIGQEKLRLGRKMEKMEDAIADTKAALQSKALVLLTDQSIAAKSALPQLTARGNSDSRVFLSHSNDLANENTPWWKKSVRLQNISMIALVALGLSAGWVINQVQHMGPMSHIVENQNNTDQIFAAQEDITLLSPNVEPEQDMAQGGMDVQAEDITQDLFERDVAAVEQKVQDLQPASGVDPKKETAIQEPLAKPTPKQEKSKAAQKKAIDKQSKAEETAVKTFLSEQKKEAATLLKRIQPDASLPAVVKQIEEKAFQGNSEAQHDLAAIYTAGHGGVKQDFARAALWFKESAAQGVPNAQYNLGVLYHKGYGVDQDLDKALQLYRAASFQGHPEAQYNLGIAYIEGIGTDYNPKKAADYFQKAALKGIVEAAYNLGLLYDNGLLGEVQSDEALFWYNYAAEKGSTEAQQARDQLLMKRGISEREMHAIINRIKLSLPVEKAGDLLNTKTSGTSSQEAALVAQVQEQLIRLGFYPGPADGIAGPLTQDAIRSYQSAHNIRANGKADKALLSHMLSSSMDDVGSKAE